MGFINYLWIIIIISFIIAVGFIVFFFFLDFNPIKWLLHKETKEEKLMIDTLLSITNKEKIKKIDCDFGIYGNVKIINIILENGIKIECSKDEFGLLNSRKRMWWKSPDTSYNLRYYKFLKRMKKIYDTEEKKRKKRKNKS